MNDLQRFLVADHIEQLERSAAAIRAERAVEPSRPRRRLAAARGRLGTLLVALGREIAGGAVSVPAAVDAAPPNGVATRDGERRSGVTPCPDDAAPLARAA